ncbi:MAG: heme exporter protein CcmD [Alphaproteobacteria bacterium]
MNHWAFVTAAYVIALVSVAALLLLSYAAMRRAEAEADRSGGRRA